MKKSSKGILCMTLASMLIGSTTISPGHKNIVYADSNVETVKENISDVKKEDNQVKSQDITKEIIDSHNSKYLVLKDNKIYGYNKSTLKTEELDISKEISKLTGDIVLPIDKKYFNITSRFGVRRDPIKGGTIKNGNVEGLPFHTGLDLAAAGISGSNIYSILEGEVKTVQKSNSGYGNLVVVDHGGFETYYAHMKNVREGLKKGDKVKAGELLGYVGTTGRSTGPHLHLEIMFGKVAVNPLLFLSPETALQAPKPAPIIKDKPEKKPEEKPKEEIKEEEVKNDNIEKVGNVAISSSVIILDTGIIRFNDSFGGEQGNEEGMYFLPVENIN